MTTRWRPEFDPENLYFITTTAAKRTRLFEREIVKRILADGLYYISLMNRVQLYSFVLMPNHFHAIVQCPPTCPVADWVRAFKASTSQLIARLSEAEQDHQALQTLRALVTRPRRYQYKVWEDGYLAKTVATAAFCAEKIEYIHNNPVQPHWQLAGAPEGYLWSSARYYASGESCVIPIRDARELLG
jgi:putative transposase